MQEEFMNRLENIIREGMENRDRSVFLSFAKDGGFAVSIDPWPKDKADEKEFITGAVVGDFDEGKMFNAVAVDCTLLSDEKMFRKSIIEP